VNQFELFELLEDRRQRLHRQKTGQGSALFLSIDDNQDAALACAQHGAAPHDFRSSLVGLGIDTGWQRHWTETRVEHVATCEMECRRFYKEIFTRSL
jgi:hypothetical protein